MNEQRNEPSSCAVCIGGSKVPYLGRKSRTNGFRVHFVAQIWMYGAVRTNREIKNPLPDGDANKLCILQCTLHGALVQ
jgi:hypothetical protein